MNKLTYIILSFSMVALSSCWLKSSGDNTGIEYAPDMYYSKGYEPMTQFSDSSKYRYNPYYMTMREPVKGTVANGQLDYQYPFDNTAEGYAASASLTIPTDLTEKELARGEVQYQIYCSVCHGEKGGNDGKVSTKQSVLKPAWANYQDPYIKNLPIGNIYHVLTYGKNNMGSYAYALTPRERWAVANYVKRLSAMDENGNIPAVANLSTTPIIQNDSLTQSK
jgi:mono/diheme cytochrome c family protein